jgi:hypothetical protein
LKILIIGGRGELGSQILKACKKVGYNCISTSRNPQKSEVYFDWMVCKTFENAFSYDVVINAAPVSDYDLYFDFVRQILCQKRIFVETTANSNLVQAIIEFQEQTKGPSLGLFVHGAGIFPGISNFLFRFALKQYPDAQKAAFNVKYSVFSKAGRDMCQLMAESLTRPSVYYQNPKWFTDKPIGPISLFQEKTNIKNTWKGFLADLPDTQYFAAIRPDLNFIGSYFTPMSDVLFPALKLFNYAPKSKFFIKLYAQGFYFMRGVVFKHRTSEMLVSVVLDDRHVTQIKVKDAIYAAGVGVAALLPLLISKIGVLRVDELTEPDVFFQQLKQNEPELFEFWV